MRKLVPLIIAGLAALAGVVSGCGSGGSSTPTPAAQNSIVGTWDLESMAYNGHTVALPGRVAGEDWGHITMVVSDNGALLVTHRSAGEAPYWQPYLYTIWQADWTLQGQAVSTTWTRIQYDYDEDGTMDAGEEFPVEYVDGVAGVQAPGGVGSIPGTSMMQSLAGMATSALGSGTWSFTVDLAAIGGDAAGQVTLSFRRHS